MFWVLCFAFVGAVVSDTPANCTYDDLQGTWKLYAGPNGHDNTLNCSKFQKSDAVRTVTVTLDFPDVCVDANGNTGYWSLIYNQGFEVVLNGYKWFAFSAYKMLNKTTVKSLCHQTAPGWTHDEHDRDWSCYLAEKQMTKPIEKIATFKDSQQAGNTQPFRNDQLYIDALNAVQKSWTATAYPQLHSYTVEEVWKRGGAPFRATPPPPVPVTDAVRMVADGLPSSWDWRNVSGKDWVSPIRNQEKCGSCYAFASCGMMEARWRIATNLTEKPVFSPQDIINCGNYSQGCAGGFPYLVGGKYGQDFGLVVEKCDPYGPNGNNGGVCPYPRTKNRCGPLYFTESYKYIGGFYGACNEALMRIELVKNGPIAISIEAYEDLQHYKGGIYHHVSNSVIEEYLNKQTSLTTEQRLRAIHPYNPWEITNHVVVIVGYGVENNTPYWWVKNSWGEAWGLHGYFKLIRGIDNISCESIAVAATPGKVVGPDN